MEKYIPALPPIPLLAFEICVVVFARNLQNEFQLVLSISFLIENLFITAFLEILISALNFHAQKFGLKTRTVVLCMLSVHETFQLCFLIYCAVQSHESALLLFFIFFFNAVKFAFEFIQIYFYTNSYVRPRKINFYQMAFNSVVIVVSCLTYGFVMYTQFQEFVVTGHFAVEIVLLILFTLYEIVGHVRPHRAFQLLLCCFCPFMVLLSLACSIQDEETWACAGLYGWSLILLIINVVIAIYCKCSSDIEYLDRCYEAGIDDIPDETNV